MKTKKDDVLVFCEDRFIRVPKSAWKLVMNAAGQMSDGWFDHARDCGVSKAKASEGFEALRKLRCL